MTTYKLVFSYFSRFLYNKNVYTIKTYKITVDRHLLHNWHFGTAYLILKLHKVQYINVPVLHKPHCKSQKQKTALQMYLAHLHNLQPKCIEGINPVALKYF